MLIECACASLGDRRTKKQKQENSERRQATNVWQSTKTQCFSPPLFTLISTYLQSNSLLLLYWLFFTLNLHFLSSVLAVFWYSVWLCLVVYLFFSTGSCFLFLRGVFKAINKNIERNELLTTFIEPVVIVFFVLFHFLIRAKIFIYHHCHQHHRVAIVLSILPMILDFVSSCNFL